VGPARGGSGYGPGIMESLRHGMREGGSTLGDAVSTGAKNSLKTVGHAVAETARSATLGDPLTLGRQLRDSARDVGAAKAVGRYAKEFYLPTNVLRGLRQGSLGSRAAHAGLLGLNVGLPALSLYGAIRHPDEQNRGRQIGGAVAGLAAAPFTSRMGGQFGFGLGALAGQAVQRAGGAVGGLFDPKAPAPPRAAYPFTGDQSL
jgi:hypothetical protein